MSFRKIDPKFFSECSGNLDGYDRFILACRHVLSDGHPILYVVRCQDFRGKALYQYLCIGGGKHDDVNEAAMVCPECMLKGDPTLADIPQLKIGQLAQRQDANSPWVVGSQIQN